MLPVLKFGAAKATKLVPPVLTILLALHHRREAKHTRAPTQNFGIIRLPREKNDNFVATFVVDIE
jgi:hypothetical protein